MKIVTRHTVLLLVLSVAFGIAAAQQPEPAAASPNAQTRSEQQRPAAQSEPAQRHQAPAAEAQSGKQEGIGQQEEADEENAALKYSPSVTALGKLVGFSPTTSYWVFTGINFAVVFGLIIWFIRAKLLSGMKNRNASIQAAMEAAKKASDDANVRLAGIEARLSKLDSEVSALKSQAEADFKVEEERIQQQAAEDAKRVVEIAEQEIAAAAKSARRELKVFAADLAVGLAEKRISVDRDTDERLVNTFVSELGKDGK